MHYNRKMTVEDILNLIRRGQVQIPPLTFRLLTKKRPDGTDAIIEIQWRGRRYRFNADIKSRSAPKYVRAGIAAACERAKPPKTFPMIIVPYLNEDQLLDLEKQEVSGIDLSGNGLVLVPGQLFVLRTGKPNRYPENLPIKNVYRRKISMAARVFLLRPRYKAVNEIQEEVNSRGGSLAISSVSKAVRRLEDDLIVGRQSGVIRLLQPDKLLEKLSGEYQALSLRGTFAGKTTLELNQFVRKISRVAQEKGNCVAVTGPSSVTQYAVMAREPAISLYCSDIHSVVASLLNECVLEEAERFVNVRILETGDDLAYFDIRKTDGIPWASPIQTYVELMAGDKRDREAAAQVAENLLMQVEVSSA